MTTGEKQDRLDAIIKDLEREEYSLGLGGNRYLSKNDLTELKWLITQLGAAWEREEGLRLGLFKAHDRLSRGILNRGEYVRQLDGTVKWELIKTVDGDLVDQLAEVLARNERLK